MLYRKLTSSEMQRLSQEEFRSSPKFPIYVLLQNIRSMWNVGSIFRSCDVARVEKVIITGYTAIPPRKEIDKTALGATEWVSWEYIQNPKEAIETLKSNGVKIAGLEITTNSRHYTDLTKQDFPICLIVGNEVTGIDDEVLSLCDLVLEIPQYGVKNSLNVAVSAGIVLMEMVHASTK